MAIKTRVGGVKDRSGDFSHWWATLAAIPASRDSLAYKRLRTIWGDQTRTRLRKVGRFLEFHAPQTETNLTVTLWENFGLFSADAWLPALMGDAGLPVPFGDIIACQWSYGWSAGKPNKIADVVSTPVAGTARRSWWWSRRSDPAAGGRRRT
jgi:hypothetical protein